MSKNLSNKVDKFIKKLSCNLSEDKDVVRDFEDEMRENLNTSILELINNGKSEEEAFAIAVSRFGDVSQLQSELAGVFNVQRKFAKIVLSFAVACLVISMILFAAHKYLNNGTYMTVPKDLNLATVAKIESGKEISEKEVDALLEKYKKNLSYVAVYRREANGSNLQAVYPSSFDRKEMKNIEENDKYFSFFVQNPKLDSYNIRVGFVIRWFNPIYMSNHIALIFLALYWVCFGIWGVVHMYSLRKISAAWIVLFFIFNLAAYILFSIENRVKVKNKIV